jgi:hypothetical protein
MSSVVTFDCVDAYYSGVARGKSDERERILTDLTDLADRFNTSTPTSHWIRDLYRFIENQSARTHENSANPRFVDAEILDFRTNARKETND